MEVDSPAVDMAETMDIQDGTEVSMAATVVTSATIEAGVSSSSSVVGSPVTTLTLTTPAPSRVSPTPAMPAPKTQAPQRLRRIPAIDPSTLIPARRSSTRSIKRKKFDDELVESSLVKTERGRSVKAGNSVTSVASTTGVSFTSSGQQQHPSPAGLVVPGHGLHVTTPALGLASEIPSTADVTLAQISTGAGTGGDALVGNIITHVPSSPAATPATALAATLTLSAATATKAAPPGGSSTLPSQSGIAPIKTGKEQTTKEEAEKQLESKPIVKPPAEKRSRPASGKSASSKGGGGSKVASSRHVATKAGGSKGAGARSGVTKSKSRTNDLSAVHTGVKFSCRFTLKEIEERWYALLYDPAISKIAMEAARQLHSDTVATIQGKALYSNAEEKLLGTVASGSQPTFDTFQSLLQQHPDVFHPARTAKTLQCHWLLMKQYHLLPDQTVQPMPRGDHILNLSDIEDFMNDDDIGDGDDDLVEQELALVDRRNKREIRHLEQELPKWQVLVDSVTGISMPDFDSQTLGVLRGRLVRYLMRSREISLGRRTKDNHVDVDLSLEGPAWKVSRRQGIIKLRNSGDFFIANEGKRPIIIDGKPVLCGNKQKLNNNSVVEISCLRFTFLINQDVINSIRTDSTKPGPPNTAGTS
ncbi:hypothetical protein PoB_002437600 [Plakobranchus ocellatus]|uniref:Microspherule protein 1 n=1 Tax=Plakobranchus ocellatus TaxID=259542 RepID=A0AAV3ZTL6_9GAST|nr:hypothetical protein PoB_002437600 [Plakobranchus ocellatus]